MKPLHQSLADLVFLFFLGLGVVILNLELQWITILILHNLERPIFMQNSASRAVTRERIVSVLQENNI